MIYRPQATESRPSCGDVGLTNDHSSVLALPLRRIAQTEPPVSRSIISSPWPLFINFFITTTTLHRHQFITRTIASSLRSYAPQKSVFSFSVSKESRSTFAMASEEPQVGDKGTCNSRTYVSSKKGPKNSRAFALYCPPSRFYQFYYTRLATSANPRLSFMELWRRPTLR